MDQRKPIAILFFSRSAGEEACHKKWLGNGSDSNYHLANQLIRKTSETLETTGIPVFHLDETQQQGDSFGEKLANAYQEVFSLGYEAVVAVGNDCATIHRVDWVALKQALSSGKNVLGPDCRKGVYLIGLTKGSFQKEAFLRLPWQTLDLFDALADYCQNPYVLPQQRDLNTRFDLIIQSKADPLLKKIIRLLNHQLIRFPELHFSCISCASPGAQSLRAPPAS